MTIMRLATLSTFAVAISAAPVIAAADDDDCEHVDGRVTSEVVTTFSDGTPCPSPLLLCTEGRFTGDLKGTFAFVADTLTPFAALDPTLAGGPAESMAATTGTLDLDTGFCDGTLALIDTSAFSVLEDGNFAGVETVDGENSSGGCADASGRIRVAGIFMGGCVDCRYEGEICLVGDMDDDDKDDDRD